MLIFLKFPCDKVFSLFESKIWQSIYYFTPIINFTSYWMAKNSSESVRTVCGSNLYKPIQIIQNKWKCFRDPYIYTLGCEMRYACDEIHRKQYIHLSTLFITLCLESHERYYFNILRMITPFYHLHFQNEIYAMAHKTTDQFSMTLY